MDTVVFPVPSERLGDVLRRGNSEERGIETESRRKVDSKDLEAKGPQARRMSWRDVHQARVEAGLLDGATLKEAWLKRRSRD